MKKLGLLSQVMEYIHCKLRRQKLSLWHYQKLSITVNNCYCNLMINTCCSHKKYPCYSLVLVTQSAGHKPYKLFFSQIILLLILKMKKLGFCLVFWLITDCVVGVSDLCKSLLIYLGFIFAVLTIDKLIFYWKFN